MDKSEIRYVSRRANRQRYKDDEIVHARYWHSDFYTGTAATLIAAGLIEDNMLPGRPGRNKTSVTVPAEESPIRQQLRIARNSNRVYTVLVKCSKDEQARRQEERDEELRRQKEAQEQKKRESYGDTRDFRTRARDGVRFAFSLARGYMMDEKEAQFDDESICEFEEIAAAAEKNLLEVIRKGTVVWPDGRMEFPVEAAKADRILQQFIQAVSADQSLVVDEFRRTE